MFYLCICRNKVNHKFGLSLYIQQAGKIVNAKNNNSLLNYKFIKCEHKNKDYWVLAD